MSSTTSVKRTNDFTIESLLSERVGKQINGSSNIEYGSPKLDGHLYDTDHGRVSNSSSRRSQIKQMGQKHSEHYYGCSPLFGKSNLQGLMSSVIDMDETHSILSYPDHMNWAYARKLHEESSFIGNWLTSLHGDAVLMRDMRCDSASWNLRTYAGNIE